MKTVLSCVGTRPNLIKIARFEKAFAAYPDMKYEVLHTGQHHDRAMSQVFFEQFGMKQPDYYLGVKPGTELEVIAEVIASFEATLKDNPPSMVLIPGDVNSSMACAIAASRMGIPIAHIESGLRSFDRTMSEEVNRIVIDAIADIHFVTEQQGVDHLLREGHKDSISLVGNPMIDSVEAFMTEIDHTPALASFGVEKGEYLVATFHRPVNVDAPDALEKVVEILEMLCSRSKVVFPIHPRTAKNLTRLGLMARLEKLPNLSSGSPLGYFEFLGLCKFAKGVVTDSGGVQGETTYLGVPCLTVRDTTELVCTIETGTNTLCRLSAQEIAPVVDAILQGTYKKGARPKFWDGRSCERMAAQVQQYLG